MAQAPPGTGIVAWFDRCAWAAMSQEDHSVWSWPRALITITAAMVLAIVIYLTIYREPAFVIGLAAAYLVLLLRARLVYVRQRDDSRRVPRS